MYKGQHVYAKLEPGSQQRGTTTTGDSEELI